MRNHGFKFAEARTKAIVIIGMAMMNMILTGCYAPGSYKVGKTGVGSNGVLVLMQFAQEHPYVIIHDGDSAWQLSNYQVNDQYTNVTGNLKELPPQRLTYKRVDIQKTNIAPPENKYPFDEMHVKVTGIVPDSSGQIILTYENIDEIQLYNKVNSQQGIAGKTALGAGIVITVTLIVVGVVLIIAAIAALIREMYKEI